MSPEPRAVTLTDRLLAEALRMQEETLGHPAATPDADARAVRAGGDFLQRIRTRAHRLPEAGAVLRRLASLRTSARLLIAALLLLALLAGSTVAAGALAAKSPASLPLLLLSVVGINLLSLMLWLLSLPLSRRVAPGLGRGLYLLWLRLAGRTNTAVMDPAAGLLRMIGSSPVGRWLAASLVHAAWLVFAVAGLLTLTLLLSLRAYSLSWEFRKEGLLRSTGPSGLTLRPGRTARCPWQATRSLLAETRKWCSTSVRRRWPVCRSTAN